MPITTPPCPLCESQRTPELYHDPNRVTVWQCRECGIGFNHRAAGMEDPGETATVWATADHHLRGHLGDTAADIRAEIARHVPTGRLLDVGCGLGEFLASVDPTRYERVGLEPDDLAAQQVRDGMRLPVTTGYYGAETFPPESVDVVIAMQVMEHVTDPRAFLAAAYKHLRPGGLVVIDVPGFYNPKFLAYRLLGLRKPVRSEFIRSHLFYYSRSTMRRLMTEAGFHVQRVVTGRYRAKAGRRALRRALVTPVDWLANAFGVGGVVAYATKPRDRGELRHVRKASTS